ncbi:MAG: gamma-glutamylcyclotransferase [Sedimentisphaerales bacterium]|nr:gamma-glutamylcyclotransferase [Sedimentisphaerales bacterium]
MLARRVNLFIYGSLRDSRIFQSVSGFAFTRRPSRIDGRTLFAEPAFLPHHRRVSPDNVYYYAVEAPASRIEGLVIHDVPASAMAEIDHYEGKRYQRETVRVHTAHGLLDAQAYLVTAESMRRHFGDRFHVNLIHELWLRKRINRFLKKHTRPGERTTDAEIERQADRELLATTERDLVMSHYQHDAISDYYLEHELDRPRPSIKHLYANPEALPYLGNYLAMVVRQVLLNQFDEQIQNRYRFELEHMRVSPRYFARTISLLAALQMINANRGVVEPIIQKCLESMAYETHDLIDYVKYAVRASKSLFERRMVEDHLNRIRSNLQPGLVPLGCELELSNVGAAAVEPLRSATKATDPVYDGFRYFYDFRLDVLCWKLGGYIDDHSGYTDLPRRRGFFEVAPGRLSVAGELSRPATADPWLLSQLIHQLAKFFQINPHSLHLSFQLRRNQIDKQRVLPLEFVKCLLALGGGPARGPERIWISRLCQGEITQITSGEELVFARTSRRNWYLGGDEIGERPPAQATTHVQQYKFIRLDKSANYEPLILCLKGLQLEFNPGDYLRAEQMQADPQLAGDYQELKEWAARPTEISPETLGLFLDVVHQGLLKERHRRPVHNLHYIDWALSSIEAQLTHFNQQLNEPKP